MMKLHIEEITAATEDVAGALSGLLKQLTSRDHSIRVDNLRDIVHSQSCRLLAAYTPEQDIVGMVTVVFFRTPSAARCRIEDLVVDESMRRRGVAAALLTEAEGLAREFGARTIDLTSHPTRAAANALYRKRGYDLRDTNVYRKFLDEVEAF